MDDGDERVTESTIHVAIKIAEMKEARARLVGRYDAERRNFLNGFH